MKLRQFNDSIGPAIVLSLMLMGCVHVVSSAKAFAEWAILVMGITALLIPAEDFC